MARVWIDIYDAAGNRLGDGAIVPIRVTIKRTLDGVGSWSAEVPRTHKRFLDLVANKKRARIFTQDPGGKRELVSGIIENVGTSEDGGGRNATISGLDDLTALWFKSVLLGRQYSAETVQDIVDDLLTLVSGWTRSGTATSTVSARFDGVSVLKALRLLLMQQGLHFRRGDAGEVEIGEMGDFNGLTAVSVGRHTQGIEDSDHLVLIERFQLVEDSYDLVNWMLPIGAGRGDAVVTLAHSDRSSPYTIESLTGPDGRTLYYIKDDASIAEYEEVQRAIQVKNITPVGTTAADIEAAANALYDAAVAQLQRFKEPLQSYKVVLRKVRQNILPGDKIRVRYYGKVLNEDGEEVDFRRIKGEFWVMDVAESVAGDHSVTLKIANIDRFELEAADIIISAIESVEIDGVVTEPYPAPMGGYVYLEEIDDSNSVVVPLDINNRVLSLSSCELRITTRPFRATAAGAASGGGATSGSGGGSTSGTTPHKHIWGSIPSSPPGTGGWANRIFSIVDNSGSIEFFQVLSSAPLPGSTRQFAAVNEQPSHSHSLPNHTHSIPNHTHDLVYGLHEDSELPDTVRISINGVDRTAALGGPWGAGGSAIDETLEIAEYINLESVLQKRHTIEFTCDDGQGLIQATVSPHVQWRTVET